jgi:hypothetical protein
MRRKRHRLWIVFWIVTAVVVAVGLIVVVRVVRLMQSIPEPVDRQPPITSGR